MEKLKELRLKKKLTQEQLANKLGVARVTIAKWENGTTIPKLKHLKKLSLVFKRKMDYFF